MHRPAVLRAQREHGGERLRVDLEIAQQATALGEQRLGGAMRELRRHVAQIGDQQRLGDVAVRRVDEPAHRLAVGAQEADEHRLVAARPRAAHEPAGAEIGAERVGTGENAKAALGGEDVERRPQQRRVERAGDQPRVAQLGRAAAHDADVGLADAVALQQLAQDEREAGVRRVDRDPLAAQVGDRRDRGCGDDAEKPVVDAHHGDEVGIAQRRPVALALLVGDEVVDRGEREVVAAGHQAVDERARARRVRQLDGDVLALEEALALRRPERQVPAAGEGDDAHGRAALGLRLRVRARAERERQRQEGEAAKRPPRHAVTPCRRDARSGTRR